MHDDLNDIDIEQVLLALGIEFDDSKGSHGWTNVCCPLHPEENPSFGMNYWHGGWVDRHDGETGNILTLVEKVKGINRDAALQWLKGMKLPQAVVLAKLRQALSKSSEHVEEDGGDLDEWVARYEQLAPNVMAKYFFDRGFSIESMIKFEVRYDEKQRGIIWPIRDRDDSLVGMVMRRVGPGDPKYLYNEGFPRRRMFFPLNHFRSGEATLVEGPLDAMWLHQYGVEGALCTFGAMSFDQVKLLKSLVISVIVAFDNNEAGRDITSRIVPRLAEFFHVKLGEHPEGVNDPQELSPEQIREMLTSAMPLLTNLMPKR